MQRVHEDSTGREALTATQENRNSALAPGWVHNSASPFLGIVMTDKQADFDFTGGLSIYSYCASLAAKFCLYFDDSQEDGPKSKACLPDNFLKSSNAH